MFTLNNECELRITQQPFHTVGRKRRAVRIFCDAAVHLVLKVDEHGHFGGSARLAGHVL